jgi:tRNA threonylcarbamoyl adenosine modification protein (Sua5/YciO/YrdC/YwlC family)
MAIIDLNIGDLTDHVAKAVTALNDGYVIVLPLENSYTLVASAFSHDAVRALHVLRGDKLGVAAQVMISKVENIDGIAREISAEARSLMKEFWPGKLSLNLRPQLGLNWDLGDTRELDWISVRIPESEFLLKVISSHGPVAVASAAKLGSHPIIDPDELPFSDIEVSAIFSAGLIPNGPLSTVIQCEGVDLSILREAAIARDQITAIAPSISAL